MSRSAASRSSTTGGTVPRSRRSPRRAGLPATVFGFSCTCGWATWRSGMAEQSTSEPQRDTVGLVAGLVFAGIGLTYLIGGNHVVSDHSDVLLPVLLVLIGLAGLVGSGLIRRPRRATETPVAPDLQDDGEP